MALLRPDHRLRPDISHPVRATVTRRRTAPRHCQWPVRTRSPQSPAAASPVTLSGASGSAGTAPTTTARPHCSYANVEASARACQLGHLSDAASRATSRTASHCHHGLEHTAHGARLPRCPSPRRAEYRPGRLPAPLSSVAVSFELSRGKPTDTRSHLDSEGATRRSSRCPIGQRIQASRGDAVQLTRAQQSTRALGE